MTEASGSRRRDQGAEPSKPLKVLFLEDLPADAHLAVRQISIAGFAPDYRIASSRADFEQGLDWGPDIIIVDYNVPGFEAPDALDVVRTHGSSAPVIVVSGSADEQMIAATIKAGARDYLQKDRLTRLGAAISNAMLEWKLQREVAVAAERAANAARFHAIFETLTDAMLTLGSEQQIESANPAAGRLFASDELAGSRVSRWITSPSGGSLRLELPKAGLSPRWTAGRGLRGDGDTFEAEWCLSVLAEGSSLLVVRDVTRQKANIAALKHKATTDPLTRLHNRSLFVDRVEHAIAESKRSSTSKAVFMIDLNGFKSINDTRGHATGDSVLIEVARRLKRTLRGVDTVARLGGDEFGILLGGSTNERQAVVVAEKLAGAVGEPIDVDGQGARVTASIGVALFPDDGRDVDELLASADAGMYFAKRNGLAVWRFAEWPTSGPTSDPSGKASV